MWSWRRRRRRRAGRSTLSTGGALLVYARTELPARLVEAVAARRPGIDPADLFPVGLPALRAQLERFAEKGFSKFVLIPAEEPASWDDELESLAEAVLPLQR